MTIRVFLHLLVGALDVCGKVQYIAHGAFRPKRVHAKGVGKAYFVVESREVAIVARLLLRGNPLQKKSAFFGVDLVDKVIHERVERNLPVLVDALLRPFLDATFIFASFAPCLLFKRVGIPDELYVSELRPKLMLHFRQERYRRKGLPDLTRVGECLPEDQFRRLSSAKPEHVLLIPLLVVIFEAGKLRP